MDGRAGSELLWTARVADGAPVSGLFASRLEDFGSNIAVVSDKGETLSYSDLAGRADAFAGQLGDVRRLLLIEASNEIETLVAYLGALRGGHPVIMASERSGQDGSRMMETYRPDAVYAVVDGAWQLDLRASGTHELHPDLGLLLSTSGSTGATKLVRLSRGAIQANAMSIGDYLGIGETDRAVTTLPIHYSYGLSVVNSHLARGAGLILTGRSVIEPEFWSLVEREQATSLAGVPYTYELFDRVGLANKALPSLRTMTQAGGRLPPETVERYGAWARARGIGFFVMYGQTEATARMAYLPPAELAAHPDCIGVAIPGGSFRLADAVGNEITEPEVDGELVYTGPNVMMGYAESPADLALGAVIDELATGDIACRNADGLYRITGRSSRFVKPFGLRISLDGIEAALGRLGLRGAATGDDTLIAVAILDGDAAATAAALAAEFKLSPTIFDVQSVADLPLLPSGKIDYRTILAAAKTRAAEASADDPGDAIAAAFAHAFAGREVGPDDTFASLGGDSLSYVNFSLELEAHLGTLPDDWEHLSLSQLQALGAVGTVQPRAGAWRGIELELLLRACAVITVVINHASTLIVGGGAAVLLMLVGFNMARFQRPRLEDGNVLPIVRSLATRIILPYYGILLVYLAWKHSFDWSALLLIGNFTGHFHSLLEPYWFLEALLQCTIVVALLFSVPAVRRASRDDPWRLGLLFLGCSLILKGAAFAIFHHARLADRTPDAVLYLLAIGWCLYFARTRARQFVMAAITVAIAVLEFAGTGSGVWDTLPYPANISHDVWLVVAVVALLWAPRLTLPAWAYVVVTGIASASFYIYLVHGIPVYIMLYVLHLQMLPVTLAISVGIGVAVAEGVRRWQGSSA